MKTPTTEMQEILDNLDSFHNVPIELLTPELARQQSQVKDAVLLTVNNHVTKRSLLGVIDPVAKVEHLVIETLAGPLLVRIYHPQDDNVIKPVALYFHGGGMVIANLNSYDASCRAICNEANCIVVSVAYRQAPEHKYPAAHDDAMAAYKWLLTSASSINADINKICVVGESAGGNLAAGVCLRSRVEGLPQPIHQVLIYPMMNAKFDTQSYKDHQDAKPLNRAMMKWFWGHYLKDENQKTSPFACPLQADSLIGLAAATVVLAEIDPLLSEGQSYAERLLGAGVAVQSRVFKGVTHEFFGMAELLPQAQDAVRFVANQLIEEFKKEHVTTTRKKLEDLQY